MAAVLSVACAPYAWAQGPSSTIHLEFLDTPASPAAPHRLKAPHSPSEVIWPPKPNETREEGAKRLEKRLRSDQGVRVHAKVIECLQTKASEYDAPAHIACGGKPARYVMAETFTMNAGDTQKKVRHKPVAYALTVPHVTVEDGAYTLKTSQKAMQAEGKTTLNISTSHIIGQWILVSLHAQVDDFILGEHEAHHGEDHTFINPHPAPRRRDLTLTQRLELGKEEVLGGDVWVSRPAGEKVRQTFPEAERLWVELTVSPMYSDSGNAPVNP